MKHFYTSLKVALIGALAILLVGLFVSFLKEKGFIHKKTLQKIDQKIFGENMQSEIWLLDLGYGHCVIIASTMPNDSQKHAQTYVTHQCFK